MFLDLKFHDIPNTVSRAAEEAMKLGVDMLNLHASGGMEMMRETADRCRKLAEKLNRPKPILLAVTILTSLDEKNLREVGLAGTVAERVVGLAELAKQAGIDGVVASPQEIVPIRQKCGPQFVIVTDIGVKAVDTYTVAFTTTAASPYFPSKALYVRPLSKVAFEKNGEYYNNTPETSVSSSPWKLIEWTKGKQIVFGPNTNYTGDLKPYVEKLIIIRASALGAKRRDRQ